MAAEKDTATLPQIDVRPPNLSEMWHSTVHWFSLHYPQILIAIGAGVIVYSLLTVLRGVGGRLKGHPGDTLGLANVVGRAFARTTHFFMVMVAARLW